MLEYGLLACCRIRWTGPGTILASKISENKLLKPEPRRPGPRSLANDAAGGIHLDWSLGTMSQVGTTLSPSHRHRRTAARGNSGLGCDAAPAKLSNRNWNASAVASVHPLVHGTLSKSVVSIHACR